MGRKIFVSYKYNDEDVQNLNWHQNSTARDYVTEFENILDSSDNIFKGEHDNEDLSKLSDDTIWEKLKTRIYDSSVTIIFISPNMKEKTKEDRDQWIPWEVSYSLSETKRINKNGDPIISHTNAMLAVVLPDINGSYSYYLEQLNCCLTPCIKHHTEILFDIIRNNKFNRIEKSIKECSVTKNIIWTGREHGYIEAVKWCDFKTSYGLYIDKACDRQQRLDEFDICYKIDESNK